MAFDIQNFINEILRKETISNRVITINDMFRTTKEAVEADDPNWQGSLSTTSINNDLIAIFGDLQDSTSWNLIHDSVDDAAFAYAKKVLISAPKIQSDLTTWSFDSPLEDVYGGNAFNEDMTPNRLYASLLSESLNPIANAYTGFSIFSSILAMSGLTSKESRSALWALGTLVSFVTSSGEYNVNIEEKDAIVFEDELMNVVNQFVSDGSMTLKNAQETFFFNVYQEVV